MQVSWIDPEDVAALAESLRPSARPKPVVPEPVIEEPVEPLVPEQQPVAVSTASASATPTPEMPNLAAFRQRLQSIREKAINAGLLTPQPAAPLDEPESTPETEAASEPVTEEPAPVQPVEETETPPPAAETPAVIPEPVAAKETQPFPIEPAPASVQEPKPEPAPPVFTSEPAPAPVPAPEPIIEPSAPVYTYTPPQPEITIAPGASVKDRLDAFAEWATRKWSPNQLLVVDEFGDLLWGPTKKAGLVLSTMMAWNAAIRASAQAASGASQVLHQSLATGEALAVIPCQTRLGTLHLAVVKAQAPSDYEITCLRDSLVEVMNIPG